MKALSPARSLLSPGWLHAEWKVTQRRDSEISAGKVIASELTLSNGTSQAEVQLLRFRPADIRFEVVTNLDGKIQGVRDAVDEPRRFWRDKRRLF